MQMHMQVVGLQKCELILPKRWPRWTMLLQAAGSVWLCWEGMQKAMPEARFRTGPSKCVMLSDNAPSDGSIASTDIACRTCSTPLFSFTNAQAQWLLIPPPQVMIDTSGWAFMYPLLRLAGVRVVCYTHYPTISTDMLKRVHTRQAAFNNDDSIAGSTLKSAAKLVYYYVFASLYGAVGACANVSFFLPHLEASQPLLLAATALSSMH